MKIISHRGAMGLAKENTASAMKEGAAYNVDFIEFDIHYTKDNKVVAYHNTTLPDGTSIKHQTYAALRKKDPDILLFRDALHACGNKRVIAESKAIGTIAKSLDVFAQFPRTVIASFLEEEILAARIHAPNHFTFILQRYHPFGILQKAAKIDAHGIAINKNWLPLLPYFYWRAKRYKRAIYTYTLNSVLIARALTILCPKLYICTNYPNRFVDKGS